MSDNQGDGFRSPSCGPADFFFVSCFCVRVCVLLLLLDFLGVTVAHTLSLSRGRTRTEKMPVRVVSARPARGFSAGLTG